MVKKTIIKILRWINNQIEGILPPEPLPPPTEAEIFEEKLQYLESLPARISGQIAILDWNIKYHNGNVLAAGIRYQVQRGINDFYCDKPDPFILDCGSNIGISVLHYKKLYPSARIVAFEPIPEIVHCLQMNLNANNANNVTVIDAAVWIEDTELSFFNDNGDGSQILDSDNLPQRFGSKVLVKAIDFRNFLTEPIDFIKMDIEGAELDVLRHCQDQLYNVQKMVVEVHYHINNPNVLVEILQILERANFYISVISPPSSGDRRIDLKEKFVSDPSFVGDTTMLVYAWRD